MNTQQKQYIEQNIELIEQGQWDDFFKDCPLGIASTLYDADIDFMYEMSRVPTGAFYGCNSIKNMNIPEGVITIEHSAFYSCDNLTSITIPNSVLNIDANAFGSCMVLRSVSIGKNVHKIGHDAFYNCIKLNRINFEGTIEQWKEVSIEKDCWMYVPARTIRCIDGITKLRH